MQVKQVNSTAATVPTASQRPKPLKRNSPPTKNPSPAKSGKPKAQATPYDIPQLTSKAQSLPQSVVKHTLVDPADMSSGDEQSMEPAVKPRKKPIPLAVAQPKHRQSVDVDEQRNLYEDVYFDSKESPADDQVLILLYLASKLLINSMLSMHFMLAVCISACR